MKYLKIVLFTIGIFSVLLIIVWRYTNKDVFWREYLDPESVYKIPSNKLYTQKALEEEFEKNTKNHNYRFFCVNGVSYDIVGLKSKEDKKLIKKYGCKRLYFYDVVSEEESKQDTMKYNYFLKYNKKMLGFLRKQER